MNIFTFMKGGLSILTLSFFSKMECRFLPDVNPDYSLLIICMIREEAVAKLKYVDTIGKLNGNCPLAESSKQLNNNHRSL